MQEAMRASAPRGELEVSQGSHKDAGQGPTAQTVVQEEGGCLQPALRLRTLVKSEGEG